MSRAGEQRIPPAAPRVAFPFLLSVCVFLGAGLLFLIQPQLGKAILPRFGSSVATWGVTLVFFQLALLAGYLYAHLLVSTCGQSRQVMVHCGLLVLACLTLPVTPGGDYAATGGGNPSVSILLLLTTTVGLPYCLLAATSPLLQRWYADAGAEYPYVLFAVSNLGSLLALLAFPFLVEPTLGLREQSWLWSGLFVGFTALLAFTAYRVPHSPRPPQVAVGNEPGQNKGWQPKWLLLSALPSALLVATTTRLSQNLPPIPFLFVVPLTLYLLSFTIVFASPRAYRRWPFGVILAISLALLTWYLNGAGMPIAQRLAIMAFALFAVCCCAHGELARLRPGPAGLTLFYLTLAAGGALGGVAASLAAPLLLQDDYEFELLLFGTSALVIGIYLQAAIPGLAANYRLRRVLKPACVLLPVAAAVLLLQHLYQVRDADWQGKVATARSFYGVLTVIRSAEEDPGEQTLTLYNGRVSHGRQFVDPARREQTTLYYGPRSGGGKAITRHPRYVEPGTALKVGAVGMGVGTMAAYLNAPARSGGEVTAQPDEIVFYEIDDVVVRFAETHFDFLERARERGVIVDILLGDARQVMQRQRAAGERQGFDVLIVDAFAGDAVPSHLLTREALQLYEYHLRDDGVMAFHISNWFFDLLPVLKGVAADAGFELRYYAGGRDRTGHDFSTWVVLSRNRVFLADDQVRKGVRRSDKEPGLLWTDDHSAILPLLDRDLFLPHEPVQ